MRMSLMFAAVTLTCCLFRFCLYRLFGELSWPLLLS